MYCFRMTTALSIRPIALLRSCCCVSSLAKLISSSATSTFRDESNSAILSNISSRRSSLSLVCSPPSSSLSLTFRSYRRCDDSWNREERALFTASTSHQLSLVVSPRPKRATTDVRGMSVRTTSLHPLQATFCCRLCGIAVSRMLISVRLVTTLQ